MALRVARLEDGAGPFWAVETAAGLARVSGAYPTTRSFFADGGEAEARILAATPARDPVDAGAVRWLSPVTRDAQFLCQATNYASHVREVGRDPATIVNNVLFRKASSCIVPADADIVRPAHVRLLDYEIELGLVLRRGFEAPVMVAEADLARFVGGLVIVNDVSARDVQISHEQFHKAKSYRSFGPVGPWLVLIDGADVDAIDDLVLTLSVDDERRQHERAGDMIFRPAATLTEVSRVMDLAPGDLVATGTPGGVALHPPSATVQRWATFLLSPRQRYAAFLKGQLKRPHYLRPGQRIDATIATPDGRLDLGRQTNRVVAAPEQG